jgi:tRNA (guanine37-N1)-methyltransferase
MRFDILTLFPDMVLNGLGESITGRAMKQGLISVNAINIRDFAGNRYGHVDDYTYGGGAGMLMQAEPIYQAYKSVVSSDDYKGKNPRVIYVTPQGRVFNQNMAKEFAAEENIVILCGHYEGVDERVLEEIVTDYVSIGDFVLTGGELPAMVMVDAIARMVPGVLGNEDSAVFECFYDNLLEYPQYTKPAVWHDRKVPDVLLSGHHKNIENWRREQAVLRTKERRPDLYTRYMETQN